MKVPLGWDREHPSHEGAPRARIGDGAQRALDAEAAIELARRIGDDVERQVRLVRPHGLRLGVEDGDLVDARADEVVMTARHLAKVEVADGAACEATKLEVGQRGVGARHAGPRAAQCDELERLGEHVARSKALRHEDSKIHVR